MFYPLLPSVPTSPKSASGGRRPRKPLANTMLKEVIRINRTSKPELLSPAGSLEKLKHAVIYGADAVYFGGKDLSLRAAADNLTLSEIKEGILFAHGQGAKVYAALNIFAHNDHFNGLVDYIKKLVEAGIDAVIVSDPGIFNAVKGNFEELPIFISVQANITNKYTALFWSELGADRVTLCRELKLSEIKEIISIADIETEIFVHGAMCFAYSGRCLLSKYLAERDANQGNCAHCCRWKYHLMEEEREGEFYPIVEDATGTYILSSKDLCLLRVLPELVSSGVSSLKIEGRMKSLHYVSVVTRVYREAIDRCYEDPLSYQVDPCWEEELQKVSHRQYTEGFMTMQEEKESSSKYLKDADFVGVVRDWQENNASARIEVRNRIFEGESLEAFMPSGKSKEILIKNLRQARDDSELKAAHANYNVYVTCSPLPKYSILRRVMKCY